jgi:hypothetical protein
LNDVNRLERCLTGLPTERDCPDAGFNGYAKQAETMRTKAQSSQQRAKEQGFNEPTPVMRVLTSSPTSARHGVEAPE